MLDTHPPTAYTPLATGQTQPPDGYGPNPHSGPKPCSRDGAGFRWHVATTIAQQENRALSELIAKGFNAYLPLHIDQPRNRIVSLFPGYLFVAFDPDDPQWVRARWTPGIWDFLRLDRYRPAPVPIGFVEDLITRTSPRRVVDDPGVTSPSLPKMPVGAIGEVLDGPLVGWRGVVALSTENRCALLLSLLGGSRVVEFKQHSVKPV